ncbi:MAG: hypothetical protein D6740_01325 [Alphaproteobacteria bacterium]|nr:MAG: hypothetical protein D6740_01325 [Alphaproteobacteria bacterium]
MFRSGLLLLLSVLLAGCASGPWPRLAGPPPHSPVPAPAPMRSMTAKPVFAFPDAQTARRFLDSLPERIAGWEKDLAELARSGQGTGEAAAGNTGQDWAGAEVLRSRRHRLEVAVTEAELKLDAARRALPAEELRIARLQARLARLKAALVALAP